MKAPDNQQKNNASEASVGKQMVGNLIDQSGLLEVASQISRRIDAEGITDPKVRSEVLIAGMKDAMTPTWSQRLISLLCSSAFWFWLIIGALVVFRAF